jgi:cholesterol transport system auxiliary component
MTPPASRPRALLLCAISAFSAAGCALTSKNDALALRYFSPDRPVDLAWTGPRSPASPASPALAAELRLGRVTSASHLDERLVYRDSDFELGYYQERRWTEAPEEYLKRRLARALFEERGLRHVVGGAAPTLEVDLIAFEEVRVPKRIARVQVAVRLLDQRAARWEETLTIEQPLGAAGKGDVADAMVAALGTALGAVVDRIADRVVSELAAPPSAPAARTVEARRP